VFKQDYEHACWLILFAALLDFFDGVIARLTHTESDFGLNFDSLSDLVAFGVSPAALMLSFLSQGDPKIVTPPCILYIICGALRLARFNVQARGQESRVFTGLPIPAAAGCMISAYLVFRGHTGLQTKVVPLLILALAILMVSKIPYPSFKVISLKNRKPFDYLVAVAVAGVLVHWFDSIEFVLLGAFCSYVGWGVVRAAPPLLKEWRSPGAKSVESPQLPSAQSAPRGASE